MKTFQQQGKCEPRKGKKSDRYRREDDLEINGFGNDDLDDVVEDNAADTETERSKNWISPVLVSI